MFKKFTFPAMLAAGALAFTIAPGEQLQASTCGGGGESVCKTNTSCVYIIFYSQCTTTKDYWNDRALDDDFTY